MKLENSLINFINFFCSGILMYIFGNILISALFFWIAGYLMLCDYIVQIFDDFKK